MISEALRLEMAPFNVKVITIITGKVESNFASNNAFGDLPPTSRYLGIKDYIAAKVVGGKNPPPGMSPENYAQRVVSDILGGATGKVWRGAFASIVRVLSLLLPSFVVVGDFLL
jgi:short-subunit dehydrogenase